MWNSRAMSCARGATGPSGGRRSTASHSPERSRYVRLDWPAENCSTSSCDGSHSVNPDWHKNAATRSTAKRSSARTGIVSVKRSHRDWCGLLGLTDGKAAQNLPRDDHAMDLVRPVVEPRGPRFAIPPLQRRVLAEAERAVDLD